jgi:hypothetical protein
MTRLVFGHAVAADGSGPDRFRFERLGSDRAEAEALPELGMSASITASVQAQFGRLWK